jgi:hypothetical protein
MHAQLRPLDPQAQHATIRSAHALTSVSYAPDDAALACTRRVPCDSTYPREIQNKYFAYFLSMRSGTCARRHRLSVFVRDTCNLALGQGYDL